MEKVAYIQEKDTDSKFQQEVAMKKTIAEKKWQEVKGSRWRRER